jgi:periplasmic divalent cation tolerance protein
VNLIAVITTVGSVEDARKLATALVERRLAACAQISQIESVYRWKGAIQHEPEFRVLFKTTAARYQDVEEAIRALHPYELPAIHALRHRTCVRAIRRMGRGEQQRHLALDT